MHGAKLVVKLRTCQGFLSDQQIVSSAYVDAGCMGDRVTGSKKGCAAGDPKTQHAAASAGGAVLDHVKGSTLFGAFARLPSLR